MDLFLVFLPRRPKYVCNLRDFNHIGLIISTPTGSTAYAVAAGASMIHPSVPAIMVTPICPHSLSFRPIVVPAGVELKVTMLLRGRCCGIQIGRLVVEIETPVFHLIYVSLEIFSCRILRLKYNNYFFI